MSAPEPSIPRLLGRLGGNLVELARTEVRQAVEGVVADVAELLDEAKADGERAAEASEAEAKAATNGGLSAKAEAHLRGTVTATVQKAMPFLSVTESHQIAKAVVAQLMDMGAIR